MRNHIEYSTYYLHKGLHNSDSGEFEESLSLNSMNDALQVGNPFLTPFPTSKPLKILSHAADNIHIFIEGTWSAVQ